MALRTFTKVFLFFWLMGMSSPIWAQEVPFTLQDRDRLIRLEATLKEFKDSVDKRFEQVDKRFGEFKDSVDKRFEQVDKRFEQLFTFLWIISGIFTALTVFTIGFAIWDRRTMIRPFEAKTKELEEKIEEMDEKGLKSLINSLREIAKADSRVAEALKKFNLL